jgi:hypothetical protein
VGAGVASTSTALTARRYGSIENANRLLRRHLKCTELSVHGPERLLEVAAELDHRPREMLAGIRPAEAHERATYRPTWPIVSETGSGVLPRRSSP